MTIEEREAALAEAAECHPADCTCWCCNWTAAVIAGYEDKAYLTVGDRERHYAQGARAARRQLCLETNPWDPTDEPEERAAWAAGWLAETEQKLAAAMRRA
jgi:hypothetical protein